MRVAVGQFSAGTDKGENTTAAGRLVEAAARAGADLVVLPESSLFGTSGGSRAIAAVAEDLDGPFVTAVAGFAGQYGIAVVVGTYEKSPDGLPHNTLVALDSRGGIVGLYRKVHLYDAFGYRESEGIAAGVPGEPMVFSLGGFGFGAFTCYDLRFPESARAAIDAGADVLLVPAMWIRGPGKEDHWSTLLKARAIENTAYVLAANQTGPLATGYSMAVDPAGVVVANAGEEAGLIVADLSRERLTRVRRQVPVLDNRRFAVVPHAVARPHP
ncbi:carbon-nitrogen hydrolase family protein [Pseudarthrobacter phenanthrenivorans]|uniref:Putative amidohydrolase n=1 Tax=Pseudarthrobacter phenanthrenivorans (strain DSM 18606 / JCM 16027 / LMG 23796 / Sphe3) TaxID=930171 RepID=F0M245_PSEPM|nr:carbon-nitrogen hydrolase family protein [Pseudarthrobacter phenanthrenivorans]ADX74248.1 putative amidohydrolase [Pseudarthrobacter phenanthrenivorans Sphe3]TPV52499.1 carbon-nitrogen hydrolase family protein [Pseudarthrobacter phenanthrenivorans]